MAKTPQLHEITPVTAGAADCSCTFCGRFIFHESRHYHVSDVGAMCVSCLGLSHITLKDDRSYVTLLRTTPDSYARRIT